MNIYPVTVKGLKSHLVLRNMTTERNFVKKNENVQKNEVVSVEQQVHLEEVLKFVLKFVTKC